MSRTEALPARSDQGIGSLVMVLRREEQGPALAFEPVSDRDLADARAELWFEACLRRGHLHVPLQTVQPKPQPLYQRAKDDTRVCVGFSLATRVPPDEEVQCVYARGCLEPVALRLARKLVADGTLQAGERTVYELHARPSCEHEERSCDKAHPDSALPARPAGGEPFPVLQALLAPLRERAQETRAEFGAADDYPVFFTRQARAKAESAARRGASSRPPVETGGLLVGPLCSCPETGALFAVVVDVLEAAHVENTTYSLTYSGQTWARIQAVMRAKQAHPSTRTHRLLGQVHGHSFLPMEGDTACEDCAARPSCARTTAFLSSEDRAWCRAVFSCQPWQLSQVFGLDARGEGVEAFYGQHGAQLIPRGYSVLEDFDP